MSASGENNGSTEVIRAQHNDETNENDGRCEVNDANELNPSQHSFTLELPVLLLFFSWNLTATVFQNQILYQTCTIYFSFNETFCLDLTNDVINDEITIDVESYASKIFMSRAVLENIIPAFIGFLIGPWADKYGRKPILLSTFLGYFLIYFFVALISLLSSVWPISPWYYLLAFIPISVLGGTCALITSLYCYITDISSQENRAFRMARMEAAVFVGLLLGALSCGPLYNATSTSFVFACAASSTFAGLAYIFFFVQESNQCAIRDASAWTKFKGLFEVQHVKDMFRTAFKKRDGYDRAIIWLTIVSCGAAIFIMGGSITLSYLFTRERFNWTITDFNMYAATNIIVQVFGNLFGIYILSKMFGVSEILLTMIAYASAMTEYIIVGSAYYSWELYVGCFIALLKGVGAPMSRSILASVVPPNDIGKIYAMTTSVESLSPIGSAPLYTFIFANTIDTFPGAFNFVSAGIYLGCVVAISLVYVFYRKRQAINYASFS